MINKRPEQLKPITTFEKPQLPNKPPTIPEGNVLYFIKGTDSNTWDVDSQIEINTIPQSVAYDYSPNFSEFDMLGRLSPVYLYTGGSDKTYSFSITIHEDMEEVSRHGTIIDFVDKLKSLSYPTKNTKGLPYLKDVYFQVGNITGVGIVNTSVSWKKPFRNGRYVMADISFTITAIDTIPEVKKHMITQTRDEIEGEYEGVIYSGVTTNQYKLIDNYLAEAGYNTNIPDFISIGETDTYRATQVSDARNTYEYNLQRLDYIYDAFATIDDTDTLTNLIRPVVEFYSSDGLSLMYNNKITLDSKVVKDTVTKMITLGNIEKNIEKYLDHYYKNVNKDLTPEQRVKIEEQLLQTIIQLEESLARVIKYGASN